MNYYDNYAIFIYMARIDLKDYLEDIEADTNVAIGTKGAKKGRAALINPVNRYELIEHTKEDDGWNSLADEPERVATTLIRDSTRKIINYIKSPDIPFDRSINSYRGCEHGCIYCYARPSHAYLGFSPGLDFETKIVYKPDGAPLLKKELSAANYKCAPISLGSNTDPYQQAERKLKLTRSILEVMLETRHPVGIITKSALIERDIDILAEMASMNLAHVFFSITTLKPSIAQKMEPRASAPARRLQALKTLTDAGIPCGVMVAPVIPFINDSEFESILDASHSNGALNAGYVFLRLPYELKEIFATWLNHHYPLQAKRVLGRIMDSRDGKLYESKFGTRMRGSGVFADLIKARFNSKKKQLSFAGMERLRTDLFRPPVAESEQFNLF